MFHIVRMIRRYLEDQVHATLGSFPVVALLGPRQVGKTILALVIVEQLGRPTLYLDLERVSTRL